METVESHQDTSEHRESNFVTCVCILPLYVSEPRQGPLDEVHYNIEPRLDSDVSSICKY